MSFVNSCSLPDHTGRNHNPKKPHLKYTLNTHTGGGTLRQQKPDGGGGGKQP